MIPRATMDLTGKKPLYRLSSASVPFPNYTQPRYGAASAPAGGTQSPQTPNPMPMTQTPTRPMVPQQSPFQSSHPQPNQAQSPQVLTPYKENGEGSEFVDGNPHVARRRGRMLFDHELIILFKGCVERKDMYLNDPNRGLFWDNVAAYMNQLTGRNFSSSSYQQIVTDRSIERRKRRRDVANGKGKAEPTSALTAAIDQWIAMEDQLLRMQTNENTPNMQKRPASDIPNMQDADRLKRPRQQSTAGPLINPSVTHYEVNTNDITQALAQEVRDLRREMGEMHRKMDLALQALKELKDK
ncbi:hypothetical protein BO94DRAFT_459017 [Aspergillus sclerotioniger CBS 115572]|uniref:Uncharacterized protein n=1 Tax=Aspergillus sclerotioniger CBS 115572 TaxID=1450535 RepID=A0A317X8M8_9EURO|nr:hypothetical protein BO94DRAFT_459017 [Aspergillus sclerotioniger CBS 115572]PWY93937.1 hypothetical protein BO94DRAFT_459017 [Aspergillus sclerotioniger CBS 115572]